jgi:4-amino-4-deoxy-L-arabinose transferase-like glycosyltransferase
VSGSLHRRLLLATLVLAFAGTLVGTASLPLFDPDEAYYPEAAREMLERRDPFDPVFNGEERWAKPILHYLAIETSFATFGVSPFAARLPSAAAGALLLAATGGTFARLAGGRAGLLAALVLATTAGHAVFSRLAVPDMLLTLFVSMALYAYLLWRRGGGTSRRLWAILFLSIGGGIATKGFLALAIPALAIGGSALLRREKEVLRGLAPLRGLLLALAVPAPWFLYMTARHGLPFVRETLWSETVLRYTTPLYHHQHPLWFFLAVAPALAYPWTGLTLASFGRLRRDPDRSLLAGWAVGGVLILSFSHSKLVNYALPLLPALTGLAALGIEDAIQTGKLPWKVAVGSGTQAIVAVVAALGVPALVRRLLPETPASPVDPLADVLALGGGVVLGAAILRGPRLFTGACVLAGLGTVGMALRVARAEAPALSPSPAFGAVYKREGSPGDLLVLYRARLPSIAFYAGARYRTARSEAELREILGGPGRTFVVAPEKELSRARAELTEERFQTLARVGRFALLRERVDRPRR